MNMNSIRWMAAIVDRGKGNKAASIFHEHHLEILLAVRGHGTASSAIMDWMNRKRIWFWESQPAPMPIRQWRL